MTQAVESHVVKASQRSGLSYWSILTVVVALPVWVMVFRGSLMSRDIDGGIYLSVASGINRNLDLYSGIWDNKDPFYFVVMGVADLISPTAPFFMDLMWVPLASLGAWLISHRYMTPDRSLFIGLVVTPVIVTGSMYAPGWTNTPGTALALLVWGLFVTRIRPQLMALLSGIALGFLFFTKVTIFPVAVLGILLLWLLREFRSRALRTIAAFIVTVSVSILVFLLVGWWSGYLSALSRNRQYASDVITYFGFEDSIAGRFDKFNAELLPEVRIAVLLAIIVVLAVGALLLIAQSVSALQVVRDLVGLELLAIAAAVGVPIILLMTYVWPHHGQALYLPLTLAAILVAAAIPFQWPYLAWLLIVIPLTLIFSGWFTPSALANHFLALEVQFSDRLNAISADPIDATLLNTVPQETFTFARLGTNDDGGFLSSIKEGALLACPQFHLYDFSPATAFAEQLTCIQSVDVIIKTDNFTTFANGMNAANAQPILDYVSANFDCLTVGDRQLCTRRSNNS